MYYQLELACTTPHDEPCAQVGSFNYSSSSRAEARALINQLIRENGNPPEGVGFKIKSNPHDFGSYLDVVIRFDEDNEEQSDYAYQIEGAIPDKWDSEAKRELAEAGYNLEVK
jgi:hypothetical protein